MINSNGLLANTSLENRQSEKPSVEILQLRLTLVKQEVLNSLESVMLNEALLEKDIQSITSALMFGSMESEVIKGIGLESILRGKEDASLESVISDLWANIVNGIETLVLELTRSYNMIHKYASSVHDLQKESSLKLAKLIIDKGYNVSDLSENGLVISLGDSYADIGGLTIETTYLVGGSYIDATDIGEIDTLARSIINQIGNFYQTRNDFIIQEAISDLILAVKSEEKDMTDLKDFEDLTDFKTILSNIDKRVLKSVESLNSIRDIVTGLETFSRPKKTSGVKVNETSLTPISTITMIDDIFSYVEDSFRVRVDGNDSKLSDSWLSVMSVDFLRKSTTYIENYVNDKNEHVPVSPSTILLNFTSTLNMLEDIRSSYHSIMIRTISSLPVATS